MITTFIKFKLNMSLVSFINGYCPLGVSHTHSINHEPEREFPHGCVICVSSPERNRFSRICPNHTLKTIVELSNSQLLILHLIFSSEEFYIPNELRFIIFKHCKYLKIENIPILLNEEGIDHMMKCRKCAPIFLEYLDKNTCPNHMIPRKNQDDENIMFNYNI